ncbi:MAG: PhnE/PtxC family ABC transporter permease, partial [Bradyrhizobium sp.]
MGARRKLLLDDADAVLDRHRDLFSGSQVWRASAFAPPLGIAGFAIFAGWWLAIPFSQIGPGLASLAKFIALMFPPSTGGHLDLLLKAMGETLAIAFLGTLIATVFAFPIGFLAAKNTSPHGTVRFAIRRGLDTIRGIDALI